MEGVSLPPGAFTPHGAASPLVAFQRCGACGGPAPAAQASPASRSATRLASLDAFRGLVMVVMLVVDYTARVESLNGAIGHAPWEGLHLADFVMPCFLWVAGASAAISLRSKSGASSRRRALLATCGRVARLFLLGVLVQGGWFPSLSLDLGAFRAMGILQRIALVSLAVALVELLVPAASGARAPRDDAHSRLLAGRVAGCCGFAILRGTVARWAAALALGALGVALTYGPRPPSHWPGCAPALSQCDPGDGGGPTACSAVADQVLLRHMGCSMPGYIDSRLLGVRRLYVQGSDGGWPPTWGFDPEGLVTTLSAVPSMFLGLHMGRVAVLSQDPLASILHGCVVGSALLVSGLGLAVVVPVNKRLWSPSYALVTGGVATLLNAALFAIADARALYPSSMQTFAVRCRRLLAPLRWLGANALLFFVLSTCSGWLEHLLRHITWGHPREEKNIVAWFQHVVLMRWARLGRSCAGPYDACAPAVMAFAWVEVAFWTCVCGALYRRRIFWKI